MSISSSGKPGLMSLPYLQTVYLPAAVLVAGTAAVKAQWLPYVLLVTGVVCSLTFFSSGTSPCPIVWPDEQD